MAQSGYTPILIYASSTPGALPSAGDLTSGASGAELAINYADGKLYFKNSSGVVTLLAGSSSGPAGGSNTQVQYNSSGVLAGSSNMTFDGTSLTLGGNPTLSGGTANGVLYLNGSKVATSGSALTFDGNTLTATNTSGNAIIASRGGKDLRFSGNYAGANTHAVISTTTGMALAFMDESSEFMRLTSTGLGIGTSSPGAKLVVAGGNAYVTNTAGNASGIELAGNGNGAASTSLFVGQGSDGLGYLFQRANLGLLFGTNNTERMRLDSSGNLGIGTSSPASKLHVSGTGTYIATFNNSSDDVRIELQRGGTQYGQISASTTSLNLVGSQSNTAIKFLVNGGTVTAATIDSSGNLGLGVTPSAWSVFKAMEFGAGSFASISNAEIDIVQNAAYLAGTNWTYNATAAATMYRQGSGAHSWWNAPSGTAGNAITFTQAMTLDSSGNLGIGTSSPVVKLQVNDTSEVAIAISTGGTRQGAFYTDGSLTVINAYQGNPLVFSVASSGVSYSEKARIDSSGNLGLGVTPSAWSTYRAMQIGAGASVIGHPTTVAEAYLSANLYYGSGNKYIGSGAATLYSQSSGVHSWSTAPSGTAGNAITFTQAMTLDASGNLGVGTTSPVSRLAVAESNTDNVTVGVWNTSSYGSGNQWSRIQLGKIENVTYQPMAEIIARPDTNASSTSGSLLFYTRASGSTGERARITSGGDLLVGVTTAAAEGGFTLYPQGSSGAPLLVWNRASTTSTTTAADFRNASTSVGNITYTNTATAYNTSSDYRLKDNPQPLTGSGAFIDALKPKTWNWTTDGSKGVGFIAHEVQEVSPGSVVGTKDAVDADGKPVMQAMEYGSAEFIANIIAELQSLRQRVALLEGN